MYEVFGVRQDSGKGMVPLASYGKAETRKAEQNLRSRAFNDECKLVLVYFHGALVSEQRQRGTL